MAEVIEPTYLLSRRGVGHQSDDGGATVRCGAGTRDLIVPDVLTLLEMGRWCKRCFRTATEPS